VSKLQFHVLYRQFLFRVFDLEVLSAHAQGDANKLLGQFAALLVFVSVSVTFGAMLFSDPKAPWMDSSGSGLVIAMVAQHFLIATTMLVVGLFAVLSWDSTFPDRRDVLVLAPLPVRARIMFLAKVAAVGTSLGLTIVLLHCAMGLLLPLLFWAHAKPAVLPALTFDANPGPISAAGLKQVMDRDLRQQLTHGELAAGTGAGMVIGVFKHGERSVFTYGAARPDSLFEIGSISKTFTGLILARMLAEGKVRLDEPVRDLLPPGTATKPSGPEITLLDLATHHSGLPGMPDNIRPADPSNPYADYSREQLYAYVKRHGVAKPDDATFAYSNLGVGLLGQVLADRAGRSYPDLVRQEITGPLGMSDTVVKLSADQQRRFLQGYNNKHQPVPAWDLDALGGAGAIRSTAGDMLRYLEANLHPEKYGAISGALAFSHQFQRVAAKDTKIALAWIFSEQSKTYWHDGGTAGFISYVFFNPEADCAAVVLLNSGPNPLLSADVLGEYVRQRLMGEPAISLDTVVVPAPSGFPGVLRSYGAYWFTMLAAGLFLYAAVLTVQGLASQLLTRRVFLRVSGYLQMLAFCVIVGVYFLQPGFGGFEGLTVGSIAHVVQWLPSYWFLALYQQLNGSMHPALAPLAQRAWIGLAAVISLAGLVYAFSYWRTLRKIVEEPDIVPGALRLRWLPRFGNQPQTAIGQFTLRTLGRSRQHRLILGFYLGIGLAFTSLLLNGSGAGASNPWQEKSMLLWAASVMMIALAAAGTRVAFALPLDLRANWIFRVIGVRGGWENLKAIRRALLLLSGAPVWLLTALTCLWLWPSRQSAVHLVVLALLGLALADLCLLGFRKIPFTCSYLPGKSRFHMIFFAAVAVLIIGSSGTMLERRAMGETGRTVVMLASLFVVWISIRIAARVLARRDDQELRFEEEVPPAVQGLGLNRDGMIPIS